MTNSTEKKYYAEEILRNPIFHDTLNKIKNDAIEKMKGLEWNDDGDAERRKLTLKLDIVDEISKQFEIMRVSDQAANVKADKI